MTADPEWARMLVGLGASAWWGSSWESGAFFDDGQRYYEEHTCPTYAACGQDVCTRLAMFGRPWEAP